MDSCNGTHDANFRIRCTNLNPTKINILSYVLCEIIYIKIYFQSISALERPKIAYNPTQVIYYFYLHLCNICYMQSTQMLKLIYPARYFM